MTPHCQETKALLHRGGEKQWGGDGREGEGGGWEKRRVWNGLSMPWLSSGSLPLAFSSSDFGQDWPAAPRAPLLPFGFLVQVISMRRGWSLPLWVLSLD